MNYIIFNIYSDCHDIQRKISVTYTYCDIPLNSNLIKCYVTYIPTMVKLIILQPCIRVQPFYTSIDYCRTKKLHIHIHVIHRIFTVIRTGFNI